MTLINNYIRFNITLLKPIVLFLALLGCSFIAHAQSHPPTPQADSAVSDIQPQKEAFEPGPHIIGHVTDAHSWHLFDIETSKGHIHTVSIPLPVILYHNGHLDLFMSSKFEHGHADYRGYRLTGGGLEKEEIVCVDTQGTILTDGTGAVVKPLDFSITKTVLGIFIAVIVIITIVLYAARRYRITKDGAPHGMQSLIEMLVVMVRDEICRPMIGPTYDRYLPYILTLFFFIFGCNILGLIPIFPGGANVTGNIAVTMVLALITFFITNLNGTKHYWKDIVNADGVPAWLKIFPLMPLIEIIGIFTKPFVLMIRLFANMTAGHIMVLSLTVVIIVISNLFGNLTGGITAVVAVLFTVFIDLLECLVAYIQAFVFTMLTAVYIGMAVAEPSEA